MDFAEKLCDHICMIDRGKAILHGPLKEIKQKFAQRNVSLNYEGNISFLKENQMIEKIEDFGNSIGIRLKDQADTQQLLKLLLDNNIVIKKFDANDISLHEIFIELAGKEHELEERSNLYV
jgi:ABC-2 type transport system ATP-binding protein